MKLIKIIAVFLTASLTINAQEKTTPKAYAELSIKEGGIWNGQKYEGGSFKNVSSLKVPKSHWDHSFFIRYEGPGWESSKMGYRLYLDWRNCIDLFGKTTDTLVLSKVGLDGFDSYHKMSPWGMDILKAGKSLGIGGIGRYNGKEVLHFNEVDSTFAKVENKANRSTVIVDYKGWKTMADKIDFQSNLSIAPTERFTKHSIKSSKKIEGICTGMVKFKEIELVRKLDSKWAYIASYGKQSLVPDNLGMAIFYKICTLKEQVTGEFDNLLVFKPSKKEVTFYLLGAWEQEKEGIKTKEAFYEYLDKKLEELNKNGKI